jgi:hypothetical protein
MEVEVPVLIDRRGHRLGDVLAVERHGWTPTGRTQAIQAHVAADRHQPGPHGLDLDPRAQCDHRLDERLLKAVLGLVIATEGEVGEIPGVELIAVIEQRKCLAVAIPCSLDEGPVVLLRLAHYVLIDVRASPIDESGSHSSIPTRPPS